MFFFLGVNTAALRASYPQSYMMVSLDCGVLAGTFNPLAGSCHSSCGLTAEEVLEIAYIAGAHPNVRNNTIYFYMYFILMVLFTQLSHSLA